MNDEKKHTAPVGIAYGSVLGPVKVPPGGDYTPSAAEIKEAYCWEFDSLGEAQWNPDSAPEFDRWFAAYTRQVKADAWDEGWTKGAESERISFGRKVSWAPKRNPYRITEENK
jgi:hypothetical protein